MVSAGICLALAGPAGSNLTAFAQPMRGIERALDRRNVPEWAVPDSFAPDIFTFVRIQYHSGGNRGWGGRWRTDYPAADLNFSYRLEELTAMRVHPEGEILQLSDPRLFEFPFIFIIDPRDLVFTEEETVNLRRYLLNGGFLMVDDFWGERMMNHLLGQMERVIPGREPVSLPLEHEIFNCVFPLSEKPQVPSEDSAHRGRATGSTWEDEISWEPPRPADYYAFLDDHGRIMVLICHNTDLSDGWEEEGISPWYFENFSEKFSYPMGINIVFYALTH